jgi:hypothetical protein
MITTWSHPPDNEPAIAKFKRYTSPGSEQIPAELFQVLGDTLVSVIQKILTDIRNKKQLPDHFTKW